MTEKLALASPPIPAVTFHNDRETLGNDPKGIDCATDRLGTGARRFAYPAMIGRPKTDAYEDTIPWEHVVVVPPYTKAIGVRARAVLEIDPDNSDAQGILKYKLSSEVTWDRYLVFDQGSYAELTTELEDVFDKEWAATSDNASPDSTEIISSPIPVDASENVQILTVQFKAESDLTFKVYDIQLTMIPYDNEPYPEV